MKITQAAIDTLMQHDGGAVISIYQPTHRHPTPPHIHEDQIRYKNLIHEAREEGKRYYDHHEIEEMYQLLEAKIDDLDFWKQATEGLALFVSPKELKIYRMPLECEERICVAETYDIAPLMALRDYDQPYYLLALAMQDTKLYKGDMYGLEPVGIEFPHSLTEALNIDEMFINSRTVKSHEGPGGARGSIGPHGEGDSREAGGDERMRYLRLIDDMIRQYRDYDPKLPVLIAGTDSEVGDYRNVTQLRHVLDGCLHGNHTKTPLNELHDEAWPVIRTTVDVAEEQDIVNRFNEGVGVQKASANLEEVTQAAEQGRVDTLALSLITATRDTISDASDVPLKKIIFGDSYDHHGLNALAATVHRNGGRIVALSKDLFKPNSPLLALYRY